LAHRAGRSVPRYSYVVDLLDLVQCRVMLLYFLTT
jgi:hypothetical protein